MKTEHELTAEYLRLRALKCCVRCNEEDRPTVITAGHTSFGVDCEKAEYMINTALAILEWAISDVP